MVKVKVIEIDVRTGKSIEKEMDLIPIEEPPIFSIDLKELAQVIEDVKQIKEKLGMVKERWTA